FQAEDGIRDHCVTGVQTCALPIFGEQSAKSLRGASMEDVIFNGSQSRQPTGMAEANLKVSASTATSPEGSPECIVTRRLYRNGESEYLMNGQICRLKDIH